MKSVSSKRVEKETSTMLQNSNESKGLKTSCKKGESNETRKEEREVWGEEDHFKNRGSPAKKTQVRFKWRERRGPKGRRSNFPTKRETGVDVNSCK